MIETAMIRMTVARPTAAIATMIAMMRIPKTT